ncbi:MAG: PAS domain-containing sensor histidine kinase [Hyphomicrobiales bacterium]|nr:MAG: PAS domain-containing sensor histidine kinase [Hyphomicrobiales bacterium]
MATGEFVSEDIVLDPPVSQLSSMRHARRYGVGIVFCAIALGFFSFVVLLGLTPFEPTVPVIVTTMVVNGILVLLLVVLVGREVNGLIQARRRGRAAARMHIRLVGLFGIVAALPAILVAVAAGITLDLGLDRIFEQRTKTIVDSSISVARSYVNQATSTLLGHTVIVASGLKRDEMRNIFLLDRGGFINFLTGQSRTLGLIGASLVRLDGTVVLKADIPVRGKLPAAPLDLLAEAAKGKPACIEPRNRNLAACAIQIPEIDGDYFLYTLRYVDPAVLNSVQLMREITQEYDQLEKSRIPLQIAFALLYFGICLTILLAAIWTGIAVADRLVAPIRLLIAAADTVRSGDLDVTVPTLRTEGELRSLSETFNAMIGNLKSQRDEILNNQEQIDKRRRFMEAVLSGVSAGVIGVSGEGRLAIANGLGLETLNIEGVDLDGASLGDINPDLGAILHRAKSSARTPYLEQITQMQKGKERTLNVQVSTDVSDQDAESYVITIDDITDLVFAQRTSAWADVARRIAHEIKNPLTPIQLSAERIRRRYGKVITEDREVFDQCIETIIRQVADIGRMVDEFSSFARTPKPIMKPGNLADSIREAVFLVRVANEDIDFEVALPEEKMMADFDNRLFGQAIGNVIKNATEAMDGVKFSDGEKPCIKVQVARDNGMHVIDIIDNGKGLPMENRQRLLEPYMTTRENGTGLGLAIVGKILEEHGGQIELLDAPQVAEGGRGAMMRISIPILRGSQLEESITNEGVSAKKNNDNGSGEDATGEIN